MQSRGKKSILDMPLSSQLGVIFISENKLKVEGFDYIIFISIVMRGLFKPDPSCSVLLRTETGGTKRKGSSKTGVQARKKPRQKAGPLDEETMVALALSSSLLEQQKESERASQAETVVSSLIPATPALKWRPDAGTLSSLYRHFPSTQTRFFKQSFYTPCWTITV